jgi:DNA-binding transcriptional ArsR family regulator
MSDILAAMAEPNRQRLLQLLRGGEQSVSELAARFHVTRSAISQHLGVLAEAGLVDVRQEGRFRFYRLNPNGLASLHAAIDAFWTTELEQLAATETPEKGIVNDH